MKVFGNDLADSKAFGNDVVKIIAYGETVWEKQTSIPDYLCFTALESGTFTLTIPAAVTATDWAYVEYSTDGRNWTKTNNSSSDVTITTPTIAANGKVYWRGSGDRTAVGATTSVLATQCSNFSSASDKQFAASGNIMSLLFADNFSGQTTLPNKTCNFTGLFYNCKGLTTPPSLPATTLRTSSYAMMFSDCTSLTSAPSLPASIVSNSGYYRMFYNCTSLATPPALSSTSLNNYAYQEMFRGCTSLASAPSLPATSIPAGAYLRMFLGCTSLTTAPSLPFTAITGSQACDSMFNGCTSLVTPPSSLPATTLSAYCYSSMFYGCTSLTSAPTIAATTLAAHCCEQMFRGCTALTTAPTLLATTLAESCYKKMFVGCTALSSAPDLLATTLATECYTEMFYGCSSLKYIKCLATDLSATDCLKNWTYYVATNGTFIQASGVSWPTGTSGIPSTWVTIEKRTMPTGYKQVEYVSNPNKKTDNGYVTNIDTGFVLDPSQDTYEYAVYPHLDSDGYLINKTGNANGEMPFANTASANTTGKTGHFYTLYRKNASYNVLMVAFNCSTGVGTSTTASNKIVESPQVVKFVHTPTSVTIFLNGAQVAARTSGFTVDTSDMTTETAKLFSYSNNIYNWEHPLYYFKWWRGGSLIADYVPCVRTSDNVVGFYDFVSNEFKTKQYTAAADFVAGAEL